MVMVLQLLINTGLALSLETPSGPYPPFVNDAELRRANLTAYWRAQLPLVRDDSVKEGFLADEVLYIVTDQGIVFALTADVGLIRWGEKLADPHDTIYRPTHRRTSSGAGQILLATSTQIHILDRFSGRTIRRFKPRVPLGRAVVGDEAVLLLGSIDTNVYALAFLDPDSLEPNTLWKVHADGPVTVTPVLYGENDLLFATQNGTVYSCGVRDKAFRWSFSTGGSILGDPVVVDSGVYVASMDRSVYKLDAGSGRALWRARLPAALPEGPILSGSNVYQYVPRHGLYALDAGTGEEKWHHATGRAIVARFENHDLIFSNKQQLQVVARESGRVLHVVDVRGALQVIAHASNDAAYLLAHDGRVLCVRPTGAGYIRPPEMATARQRLNHPPTYEPASDSSVTGQTDGSVDTTQDDPLRSRSDQP